MCFLIIRSASSLSQMHCPGDDNDCGKRFSKDDYLNGFTIFDRWQQQRLEHAKLGIVPEPGMAFGSMGIAGCGLDDSELGMMADGCPPVRSMWFVDDEDYLNRAPLSRAVSTMLLNHYPSSFTSPTFDRQSQFVIGCNSVSSSRVVMRRAHSMNDINLRPSAISPDIKFGRMDRQPFDYLRSAGRHGMLIRGESDDFQRSYKDVAL